MMGKVTSSIPLPPSPTQSSKDSRPYSKFGERSHTALPLGHSLSPCYVLERRTEYVVEAHYFEQQISGVKEHYFLEIVPPTGNAQRNFFPQIPLSLKKKLLGFTLYPRLQWKLSYTVTLNEKRTLT